MLAKTPSAQTLARLTAVVGPAHAINTAHDMAPYLHELREKWVGRAALVLKPGSVEEVCKILAIAHETDTKIVPQGGNTGLVGAQIPFESGNEIVLSLTRLNRIRRVDAVDNTITVEAGMTLKAVQDAAAAADRYFPLSLGSEGSCTIGGNLATNAGGVAVLTYGNAREMALGLEVVLADGRLWNGLRRLRKDNTGYDLRDLFIGSEGTLGIITAAVLKLFPRPTDKVTVWVATPSPQKSLELLNLARSLSGGHVSAMEIVPRLGLEIAMRHAGVRDPLQTSSPWYVLMEFSASQKPGTLEPVAEAVLAEALELGLVSDGVIAVSEAQSAALWNIREQIPLVQKLEGGSIRQDVSVPVSRVPEFLERASRGVLAVVPDARPLAFGHIGDGNIHFNVVAPAEGDRARFKALAEEISKPVYDAVIALDGSISAEHGIGRLKRDLMGRIKSPTELELMISLKTLLDPKGILNPGKVLPDA